jgi:hypothetical protein
MNGHVLDQLVSAEPPSLGLHNIEFSCPAASTQRYIELPDCIPQSNQHPRGQLQRHVMLQPFLGPSAGFHFRISVVSAILRSISLVDIVSGLYAMLS